MVPYSTKTLAALCIRTLDNLKASNIVALDLRSLDGSPSDYFLICSANSDVHARALADAVTRTADTAGYTRPKVEGRDAAEWVLLDFFDIAVHIFRGDAREYYKLEKLWGDAPQVDIIQQEQEEQEALKPKKKAASKGTTTTAKPKTASKPKASASKTTKPATKVASKTSSQAISTTKKTASASKKAASKTTSAAVSTSPKKKATTTTKASGDAALEKTAKVAKTAKTK
jgi:ribosome-associated protein